MAVGASVSAPWRTTPGMLAGGCGVLVAAATLLDGGSSARGAALATAVPLVVLLVHLAGVAAGRASPLRPPLALLAAVSAAAGLAALALASMSWSLAPELSWTDAVRGCAAAGALGLGAIGGRRLAAPAATWATVLLAVACGIVAISLVQRALPIEQFVKYQANPQRMATPFGYPNALGALCAVAVPVALWLAAGRSVMARLLGCAGAGLLLVVLPLTGSRGAILALALALVVLLMLVPDRLSPLIALAAALVPAVVCARLALDLDTFSRPPTTYILPLRGGPLLLLAALAATAAAGLLGLTLLHASDRLSPPSRARLMRRLAVGGAIAIVVFAIAGVVRAGGPIDALDSVGSAIGGDDQQVTANPADRLTSLGSNLRTQWWDEAVDAWEQAPLLGQGAGTFKVVDALLRERGTQPSTEAHSLFFHVLSGLGLAGVALLAVMLAGMLAAAVAGARRMQGPERGAAGALVAALVCLLAHSMLDWDWSFTALTLLVFPVAGLLATAERPPARPAGGDERLRAGGLAALAIAGVIVALLPLLSERAEARADRHETAGRTDEALIETDLAIALEPVAIRPRMDRVELLQQLDRPRDAAREMREALRIEPWSYEVWELAGQMQRDCWHEPAAAWRRSLRRAVALSGGAIAEIADVEPLAFCEEAPG